jgi:tetratricopeptide (TPR) repeat protein
MKFCVVDLRKNLLRGHVMSWGRYDECEKNNYVRPSYRLATKLSISRALVFTRFRPVDIINRALYRVGWRIIISFIPLILTLALLNEIDSNAILSQPLDQLPMLLIKANSLYARYNYSGALGYFTEALKIEPNNTYILSRIGAALFDSGHVDESIAYFDKALSIQPNDIRALVTMGRAQGLVGNYSEAIFYFDRSLKIYQNNSQALYGKGEALVAMGYPKESLAYLDRAIEMDPLNSYVLMIKGIALEKVGNVKQAMSTFDKVLEIDPSNWYVRGLKSKLLNITIVR